MNKVKAKIYYLILTGEALIITSECQGSVEETTKEFDMTFYPQLKDRNIDDVDYIELEYGTLASTFNNVKSYSINLETKQLKVTYYAQEELDAMNQKNQETQDLNSRVSDLSQYIQNQDGQSISGIEDYILKTEQNKIITGGM